MSPFDHKPRRTIKKRRLSPRKAYSEALAVSDAIETAKATGNEWQAVHGKLIHIDLTAF